MAMTLRPAQPSDIPELQRLIERSARVLSAGYYSSEQIESAIRYVFGIDSTLIADGTYFAVVEGDALIGCGGWSRRRTLYGGDQRPMGSADLLDPRTDAARIRAFFISPAHARRGIGGKLLQACESAAREAGFRSLELMATLPGVPFYAALGYEPQERQSDVLPDGVAIEFVLMRKSMASRD